MADCSGRELSCAGHGELPAGMGSSGRAVLPVGRSLHRPQLHGECLFVHMYQTTFLEFAAK